jgi:hypothetical protein
MDFLKTLAMLEALKLELQKHGKNEDLQAQVVDSILYSFLSIGMLYVDGVFWYTKHVHCTSV